MDPSGKDYLNLIPTISKLNDFPNSRIECTKSSVLKSDLPPPPDSPIVSIPKQLITNPEEFVTPPNQVVHPRLSVLTLNPQHPGIQSLQSSSEDLNLISPLCPRRRRATLPLGCPALPPHQPFLTTGTTSVRKPPTSQATSGQVEGQNL